jgi:cytochrome c biogenesis protein CcdA
MMLAIGLFYALGVFITYSLIGAGLLGGLKRIAVESGMRRILEYVLAGFLIILSALSLVDAIKLSRGRTDLILKLPEKLSGRVHSLIRTEVSSGAAAGGALVLGAVVALIELGCTGQVYLPTIAWMIARGDGAVPWLWLAIYNSAFIIPLLIVFVVSYKGVTAVKLAGAFRKRGAAVKFVTAGLLAILAIVVFIA